MEKVLGDSTIMKGVRITIPKEIREKECKRRFLYLFIERMDLQKIKTLEFNLDKSIKHIERLKKKNYC